MSETKMGKFHKHKIDEEAFSKIQKSKRRALVVPDDSDYEIGDGLLLTVVKDGHISGTGMMVRITDVNRCGPLEQGITSGWVMLSISTPEDANTALALEIAESVRAIVQKIMLFRM